VRRAVSVTLSYQGDGRTLKVFVTRLVVEEGNGGRITGTLNWELRSSGWCAACRSFSFCGSRFGNRIARHA